MPTWMCYLGLGCNGLTGEIPFADYKGELLLESNKLSGTIDMNPADLWVLNLQSNSLSDSVPGALMSSSVIWVVDLSDNDLCGSLGDFVLAPYFSISGNKLIGTLCTDIAAAFAISAIAMPFADPRNR